RRMSGAQTAARNSVIAAHANARVSGARGAPSQIAPACISILQSAARTQEASARPARRATRDPSARRAAMVPGLEMALVITARMIARGVRSGFAISPDTKSEYKG